MQNILNSLELMWKGMLAIFLVTIIIILFVSTLNIFTSGNLKKIFSKHKHKDKDDDNT